MNKKGTGAEGTRPLCGAPKAALVFLVFFFVFSALDLCFCVFPGASPDFVPIFSGIASVSPCAARIRTCIFTPILRLALPGIFSVLFALI